MTKVLSDFAGRGKRQQEICYFSAQPMQHAIQFEDEDLQIHAFRPEDIGRYEAIARDLFTILSNDTTVKYVPSKRLNTLADAEALLQMMILNHHSGRNQSFFISIKASEKVIGILDLIPPEVAMEHYTISQYPYFIEFYLSKDYTGCQIMSTILPLVMDALIDQGITNIGAIVNRRNIAARKILEKSSFTFSNQFDRVQDFYELTVTEGYGIPAVP